MAAKKVFSSIPPRTAMVVLGMHRSGTSVLANVLAELGCDLPQTLMKRTQDNARGYFESGKIYHLNNQVLEIAGSSWDDWTQISDDWFENPRMPELKVRASNVFEAEFAGSPLLVLKDPRICRLMPLWVDTLERNNCMPLIIHTHRNPLEVAGSINRRDGLSVEVSLLIWLRHVLEAEHSSRGMRRSFTSYDRLLRNVGGQIKKIQADLGVNLPKFNDRILRGVQRVVSTDLRHFNQTAEDLLGDPGVSDWVRDIFGILERWAADGEDTKDHVNFDRIRNGLNQAASAFFGVVESERALSAEVSRLSARIADAGCSDLQPGAAWPLSDVDMPIGEARENADIPLGLSDLEAEIAALKDQLHQCNSALRQRMAEADEVGAALKEKDSALSLKDNDIKALNEQLQVEKSALASRFHEIASLTAVIVSKETDMETQMSKVHQLQSKVQQLQSKVHQLQSEVQHHQAAFQDARTAAAVAAEEVTLLRNSTSWRLMAPLRGVAYLLGRR